MTSDEDCGEAAYAAMYRAQPSRVKDLYEDARLHFRKAITEAEQSGQSGEAARLTARLEHITNVFNHQFRGIGY